MKFGVELLLVRESRTNAARTKASTKIQDTLFILVKPLNDALTNLVGRTRINGKYN